jgi:hypothetical protein
LGSVSPGLLDFLGVMQVSARKNLFGWEPRQTALPLVTMGQRPVFRDATGTLLGITAERFDPEKTVFLPPEAEGVVQSKDFLPGVRYMMEDMLPHRLIIRTQSPEPTMLVVAQTYYHAWTAYVDNQPTRIWRANHAYQAIELPAGEHQVRFVYEDRIFYLGAFLSVATLVLCGFVWMKLKPRPTRR